MARARADERVRKAADHLRARVNGAYAEDKLSFLDRYLPPALTVTSKWWPERVYLDLFAGPGLNIVDGTAHEYEGAALRALRARSSNKSAVGFTQALLVNVDPRDADALERRVDALEARGELAVPRERVRIVCANANVVVQECRKYLPQQRAYVFAFADPESPTQWPWSSVEALRRECPTALDLYMLFPDDMGIRRMLAYNAQRLEPNVEALTRFFGTDAWRPHWDDRITPARRGTLMRALSTLYIERLRKLWAHAHAVRKIRLKGDAGLYSMLFATANETAYKLVQWETDTVNPQQDLFGQTA